MANLKGKVITRTTPRKRSTKAKTASGDPLKVKKVNLNGRIVYLESVLRHGGGVKVSTPRAKYWVVVKRSEGVAVGKTGYGKFSF